MNTEKSTIKENNSFFSRNSYLLIPGIAGIIVAFLLFAYQQWPLTEKIESFLSHPLFAPIAGLLSIVLAFATVLLYFKAQKEQRKIAYKSGESAEKINLVYNRISETIGIRRYVELAAEMYKKKGVDRVVTSLQHWMTNKDVEEGIAQSGTKELIIIGRIDWNQYLPGVLWRFVHLREKAKQNLINAVSQTLRIVHVEPNTQLPLFVVSRLTEGKDDGLIKHKKTKAKPELLVGNPSEGRTTENYGIPLGKRSLGQVFFYNFLCDALLLLLPKMNKNGPNIHEFLKEELRELPKVQDGLQRLLCCDKNDALVEFRHRLCTSCPHNRDIWQWVKEQLTDALIKLVQQKSKADETHLLVKLESMEEIVSKFIDELRETGIIEQTTDKYGDVKLEIVEASANCDIFLR